MFVANTVRATLSILLALGLFSALRLSYITFTGGTACPNVEGIYICYIVLISYTAMVPAQFGTRRWTRPLFFMGWAVTFMIASAGTILEFINGETCPKSSGGLPMCYVSLGLCIAIITFFTFRSMHLEKK
ncbi:MAG: hypothetical protein HQ517_09275 [SAR324 cluster bacterium]|nr:hypothetical protein [SAR324 cluster bacterium]